MENMCIRRGRKLCV